MSVTGFEDFDGARAVPKLGGLCVTGGFSLKDRRRVVRGLKFPNALDVAGVGEIEAIVLQAGPPWSADRGNLCRTRGRGHLHR